MFRYDVLEEQLSIVVSEYLLVSTPIDTQDVIKAMSDAVRNLDPGYKPAITFVACAKRVSGPSYSSPPFADSTSITCGPWPSTRRSDGSTATTLSKGE